MKLQVLIFLIGIFALNPDHGLCTLIPNQGSAYYEARVTLNDTELVQFCLSKEPGEVKYGYHHPFYCSKYINCWYRPDGNGVPELTIQERTCLECPRGTKSKQGCIYGHRHWDQENQKCTSKSDKGGQSCRQEELPKNNIWGHPDLAPLCATTAVGVTEYWPHPHHCGKYIECYKDPQYLGDLYVEVKSCASCIKAPNCPDGYEYYKSNGTCSLVNEKTNKCLIQSHLPPPPAPSTPIKPFTKSPNYGSLLTHPIAVGGNATELAQTFCNKTIAESNRYKHPEHCHKYIHCWQGLFDDEGDAQEINETRHLEFDCPPCEHEPKTCPTGYAYFNENSQECESAENSNCSTLNNNKEISVTDAPPVKESKQKPLLNDSEVTEFCKTKNGTSGDYPHPTDKSCAKYITCWFQQEYFMEKNCESCDIDATTCPHGYHYFDKVTQSCNTANNVSSCIPEKTGNNTEKNNATIKSKVPNPAEEGESPTNEDLMTPKKCKPKNYVQRGYCKTFFTCDKRTRFEKLDKCSNRLYWNPDKNTIHGGVCDYLRNIDNYTLYQYKKDPSCALHVAYFRADEQKECSGTYYYHHPKNTEGKERKLQCPEFLLWSPTVKTCVKCMDAFKKDNTKCCDTDKDYDDR